MAGDFKIEQLSGQSFRIQFFTTTGVIDENTPWGELQEVAYELRDPSTRTGGTGQELIRSRNRNLLSTAMQDPEERFLLGNVQTLEFACFDGYDWRESWDTSLGDTNLPSAIRVRIQLAGDNLTDSRNLQPYEMIVPLLCQSRTNQTQTATQ